MIETDKVSFYGLRTNAVNWATSITGEQIGVITFLYQLSYGNIFYLMNSIGHMCETSDRDCPWDCWTGSDLMNEKCWWGFLGLGKMESNRAVNWSLDMLGRLSAIVIFLYWTQKIWDGSRKKLSNQVAFLMSCGNFKRRKQ